MVDAIVLVVHTGKLSLGDLVLVVGAVVVGVAAWRSKRGDFYKEQAEEERARSEKLAAENARLHELTDITPIVATMRDVSSALERHAVALHEGAKVQAQSLAKIAEMNGSVRANTVVLEALADRLIVEESARGLLAAASKERPSRRRTA